MRSQRGNADDALLRRLWGPDWHNLLAAPAGRRRRHAGTVALGIAALGLAAARQRRAATLAALGWLGATGDFVAARLRAAPRSDLLPLLVTSVAIPPLAVGHWLSGWYRHRRAKPWSPAFAGGRARVPSRVVELDERHQATLRSTSAASSAETVAAQPLSSLESGSPARCNA
jgi:hypothetical protein